MGATALLMAATEGDIGQPAGPSPLLLLGATGVSRLLGVTGLHVVSRVFGVLVSLGSF